MQVLKDLKRFFTGVIAGKPARLRLWQAGAPRYGMQGRLRFTVGRGPVPRHASICTRNDLGWRSVFAQVGQSRGTGPRPTVGEAAVLLTCSGSGDPELQSPQGPKGP